LVVGKGAREVQLFQMICPIVSFEYWRFGFSCGAMIIEEAKKRAADSAAAAAASSFQGSSWAASPASLAYYA
jgi:hypothetical protein